MSGTAKPTKRLKRLAAIDGPFRTLHTGTSKLGRKSRAKPIKYD